jgi:hypothetical protein
VQAHIDAGADYIVLSPACGHRDRPRQLALVADVLATLGVARA